MPDALTGAASMPPEADFVSRLERFEAVDSTQRIVSGWLVEGTPEVCIAVADEQTAGRGRAGRDWMAPRGAALLASAGFRPAALPLGRAWRLAAVVSLAMLDAAEDVAGLQDATLRLKWPNDLVADAPDGRLVKVAGVLGETSATATAVDTAVVGIGVNADWPAEWFPPALAPGMTSLRELSGGRPIDRDALLEAWLLRLEPRVEALRAGVFDAGGWSSRQVTTGRRVEVETASGIVAGTGAGVDPERGALLVERPAAEGGVLAIDSGEVVRCRVVDLPARRR